MQMFSMDTMGLLYEELNCLSKLSKILEIPLVQVAYDCMYRKINDTFLGLMRKATKLCG